MDNHDCCHDQSQNMHEVGSALEYNRVRQLNGSRVALRFYARRPQQAVFSHDGTKRQRGLVA